MIRVHFKMYKKGKKWITAMLGVAGAVAALAVSTTGYADQSIANTGASNQAPSSEVTSQSATVPATAAVPSTDSSNQASSLPDAYDGNIIISGPDQNQEQRDNLNAQLDQAKQATSQAQDEYQQISSEYAPYQNATNAKKNYDAAQERAREIQYYDVVRHQLPEKRDSLNRQSNQLYKRAYEQNQRAESARAQRTKLAEQLKTATGEQANIINIQIKQLDAEYAQANQLFSLYSSRGTNYMNQAQKYSHRITDLLLNPDGYQFDPDFDTFALQTDTTQPDWLTKNPVKDYQYYLDVMREWTEEARKAGFPSVEDFYQAELKRITDPQSLQAALKAARQKEDAAEERQTELQDQLDALPLIRQASRTVTRMICVTSPNGQMNYYYQEVTIHGRAQILNGQFAYSDWETAEWPEFTAEAVPGYETPTVPAMVVDANTKDQSVNCEYQVLQQEQHGEIKSVEMMPGRGEDEAILGVNGWYTTTASTYLTHAYILLKDQTTGEILDAESYIPLPSSEIAAKYPNIPNSDHAAFSVPLRLLRSQLTDQLAIIIRYTDGDSYDEGNHEDYTLQISNPDMGNHAKLEQVDFENGQLRVKGWHATNLSPGSTHTLILYDVTQHRQLAKTVVEIDLRKDIAQQYPTIYNAGYSGFDANFDVVPAMLSDNLEIISRWSGNDTDNGVDYAFALPHLLSGTANNAYLDREDINAGQLHVSGWHATNQAIGKLHHVIILYDATQHRELARKDCSNMQRLDVAKVYPQTFNAAISGFDVLFDLDPAMLTDQVQIVSRWYENDQNSNYVDYWFPAKQLLSGTANNAYLDQAKIIDGQLHVSGWHATNQALNRPYHTIIIYDADQNRELSRQTVQLGQRNDVAKIYPQVANASDSGFSAHFALNPALATDQIQVISRWSKDQGANSDYVDYWFAPQRLITDHNNYAHLDNITDRRIDDNHYQLRITGWNATNQAIGRPYHYLIAIDQNTGREIARQLVTSGTERTDVARAYPTVVNAGDSGFDVSFNITPELAQSNLAFISRWTDDPAGNGNMADYWFRPSLNHTGYGYLDSKQLVTSNDGKRLLSVSGWQASDVSLLRPYHTLILFDNTRNREVSRVANISQTTRSDVAKAYPSLRTADRSGFTNIVFPIYDINTDDDFTIISRYAATADSNNNYVDNYYFHLGQL